MSTSAFILRIASIGYSARFTVENDIVTGYFENFNPTTNILAASIFPEPFDDFTADNIFSNGFFGDQGINIISPFLGNYLGTNIDFFNFFKFENRNYLWSVFHSDIIDLNVEIFPFVPPRPPAPQPQWRFPLKSLFTNNAQVYYKPHSLSTGSGGSGVTNQRLKKRKT